MKILIIFVGLSIINVIFSTIRSILTIKGNKTIASLMNGGYFAFYNIMLIYTVADFPMWQKCLITFVCNVVGVYIVKLIEQKMRKDKLWKIETTIKGRHTKEVAQLLDRAKIPYNYIENVGQYTILNIYSKSQKQSIAIKEILKQYNAKYFVTETKYL